ncbi:17273_t:CDS:1, partial [Dentiscutata heterogama]
SITKSLPGATYDPELKQRHNDINKNRKNKRNRTQSDSIDSKNAEDYSRNLDVK